jgi:hypothetical protein
MKLIIALLVICVTFIACGGSRTDITVKAETGYLKFTGNLQSFTFTLDDGVKYAYNPKVELIEVKPGKHEIKVFRNQETIVDRLIIIDNHTTFEIEVP